MNHRAQSTNDHEHSPQRRQESVTSPLHRLSTAAVENSPKRHSVVAAQANGDTSGDTPPLRRQSTSVGEHHRAIPDDAGYRTGANRSSVSADTSPRRQSASANSERRPSSAFDGDRLRTGIGSSRSTTSIHSDLRQSISIAEPQRRASTTSALQRRASNVVPLKDVEHLPPWSEVDSNDNDNTDAAQQIVDRIVATTERRSTVTGHSLDGQLANPISTLDEMVSSSPPEQPLMSSSLHSSMYGGASNRRESRLLVGTTTQQSFHEFTEGSAVSIALQSPKKRISESAADATRRKPSEVVIEKAMREAQSLNYSLTSGDSVGSRPDAELSESRRVMMSADGMCAVARASHMPSRASVTTKQQHHRYDIPLHLSFSLDNSISRVKPDFRRNTTGGHTNTF
ncbi:Hypothetical protein, putative [Bodo saltans]|uniref:Uncharacterized protein n=1 Tax=Bodo saltans TaxID=75058 RepID=A0A0S4JML2_BODSA|nr:Hypothetical protein, putative [Bodo saltans]|eukprot:CUG91887.1 Hypothetical protein, putative [Bodo saltans]